MKVFTFIADTAPEAVAQIRAQLGPEAVVAKLIKALESPRPRARYRVGLPTHAAALLKRALPDVLMDPILKRM